MLIVTKFYTLSFNIRDCDHTIMYHIIPHSILVVSMVDYGHVILNKKFHSPRVQWKTFHCTPRSAIVFFIALAQFLSVKKLFVRSSTHSLLYAGFGFEMNAK